MAGALTAAALTGVAAGAADFFSSTIDFALAAVALVGLFFSITAGAVAAGLDGAGVVVVVAAAAAAVVVVVVAISETLRFLD
jgi:hypothetical protein